MNYSDWFINNRSRLTGNGIWLQGNEVGLEENSGNFRILISRLSTYRDVTASSTHKILYQIANSDLDTFADLSYLPPPRDARIMISAHIPWLIGCKSKLGAKSFNLIAISDSLTQELINLPQLLEHSGIPLDPLKRMNSPEIPLIILGGSNSANTSILWHDKSPVDGIYIGDNYSEIKNIFSVIKKLTSENKSKKEILLELKSINGFFIPGENNFIKISHHNISNEFISDNYFLLFDDDSCDTASIRISEGCPHLCSFCAESWQKKPYREIPAEVVIANAMELKKKLGITSIDLYSFNFNIHSQIDTIITELSKYFKNVGLKSQRFDMIARFPEMLPFISEAGKSSITCGLEGISQRLRNYLAKSLDLADLEKSILTVLTSNIRELKIFIIVTGKEQQEDFDEFRLMLQLMRKQNSKIRIIVSSTPIVFFPHTPLANGKSAEPDILISITKNIKSICISNNVEFREAASSYESFVSQMIIRGNKNIWNSLIAAIKKERFIYYDGIPQQFADTFRKLIKISGEDPKIIMQNWDSSSAYGFIDYGFSVGYIDSVYNNCDNYLHQKSCIGTDFEGKCLSCGICKPDNIKMITSKRIYNFNYNDIAKIKRDAQRNEKPISFIIETIQSNTASPSYISTVLAMGLMRTIPDIAPFFRQFRADKANPYLYHAFILPDGFISFLQYDNFTDLAEKISEHTKRFVLVKKIYIEK